jgi:hypothetical protein
MDDLIDDGRGSAGPVTLQRPMPPEPQQRIPA